MTDETLRLSRHDFVGHPNTSETQEVESVSGLEADHPEGNEEDIRKWWDVDNNISQRVHAYDPNRLSEEDSINFCNKKYDDHDISGKKAIWIAFSFRHQEADMNSLLGYDVNSDEKTWWDTYNTSQHQHMMDPHQMLYGSMELSAKKYDELNQEERNEVDAIFAKKHSESSSANKHPKAGEMNMEDVGDAEYNHILGLLDDDKVPHTGYDRDEDMEEIWDLISPEQRQHFQDPADLDYQKADLEQTGYWELEPEEQDDFFNYAHTMESTAFEDDNPHPGVDHFGWQNKCTLCGKQLFTPEELEKRQKDYDERMRKIRSKEATPNIGAVGWWNSLSREEKAGIIGDPDIYDLQYKDLSDLQMDQVNYTHFRNKIPNPQNYQPKGSPDGDD